MYTHSIHNGLILKNVRVEIVHETNPVFADEEVSAIVRFRHLGHPPKTHKTKEVNTNGNGHAGSSSHDDAVRTDKDSKPATGEIDPNETSDGWFGKRLSMQLSNTARSLFLEQLDESEQEKIKPLDRPVDLMSGYIQLSGFFTYDADVIEHEKVDTFRKKAAVSGRIGGLEGLEVSKNNEGGLLRMFNNFGNILGSPMEDLKIDDNRDSVNTSNLVPFFSTSQSLLFSQIHLEAGQVQTFYFKCKLPKTLPPTYNGNSIKITYHTVVGAALGENIPKPLNVHFPLRVSSFFDKNGYQPVSNLDQFILLPSNKIFNETVISSHNRRRSSFKSIKNVVLTQPELSHTEKQAKFIEKMKELIKSDSAVIPQVEEFITPKVRDVITTYCETALSHQEIDPDEKKFIKIDDYNFEKQITKFQSKYLISKNQNSITTLSFSKPFYKIGEQIRLSFDFRDQKYKTTGVLITLENLELIKDSYSADPSSTKTNPRSVTHYKESFTCFDLQTLSVTIPIPLGTTSQFKTNIFELKWGLSIKLIITDNDYLNEVHKDPTGTFLFAKENLNGEEFKIRLPVIVLPSDQDFGGIPL